jgi:hypothetical protein
MAAQPADPATTVAIMTMLIGGVTAVGVIGAVVFALLAWHNTRHSQFMELWKEYQTPEMLRALRMLHGLWEECEKRVERKPRVTIEQRREQTNKAVVAMFVKRYRAGDVELDEARRKVSHFFQRLALLNDYRLIPYRFRREWFGVTLHVIAVLYPIETEAMKQVIPGKKYLPEELPMQGLHTDFGRMFGLYNEWRRMQRRKQPVERMHDVLLLAWLLGVGAAVVSVIFAVLRIVAPK